MFILDIIVLVIVVSLVNGQNNRITRLEKLLNAKTGTSRDPASVISNQAAASAMPNTSAPLQATANPIAKPPVFEFPPQSIPKEASTIAPESAEHSEEAGGRLLGRLGVAAVLLGVAFFLKYAFENNWVGPGGRVMIGILFGLAFLGLGQYLRKKYLMYSDLLLGGGIAILYLSVYSAHTFYSLINSFTAGVFMLCVTALAFIISIVNATSTLSLVGIVGGFATPFLVGDSGNKMIEIFGFVMLLNLGVLGISLFKKWPKLLLAAFVGTAINFLAWFTAYYSSSDLAPTLFFIFVTFLIFLAASVSRIISTGTKADTGDYFMLGANAFSLAFMGYVLLKPGFDSILGFAAVFVAIIYMVVAYAANIYNRDDKALNIFLPGLAVVFLSIAVPLQFSGPWIGISWLVESCFLYFIATIIGNRGFQVMGATVYTLGATYTLIWTFSHLTYENFIPIFNQKFIALALIVVTAYVIAYMYKRYGSITPEIQKRGVAVFIIVANIFTVYTFSMEIDSYYRAQKMEVTAKFERERTDTQIYNNGGYYSPEMYRAHENQRIKVASLNNRSNTTVSILWALYAALLIGIGFAKRIAEIRRLGLILFVITAIKVVINVWSLGQIYRIISFIVFGLIALIASFAYAKYKDRLKAHS